jgi:hypothetical protein
VLKLGNFCKRFVFILLQGKITRKLIMANKIGANEFQTKVLNDINGTATNAREEMLAKKAEYEAAMDQLSVFQRQKNILERDVQYSSASPDKVSKYRKTLSLFHQSDRNTDILRSSLQNSISYCGKMINSAAYANQMIG